MGLATIALASCAATRSDQLSEKEILAVGSAEEFIARHGYTAAGHPSDLPVEKVESMDIVAEPEQLVEWRRNTLERDAFGITPCLCDTDAYYVFFHRIHHADGFRGVLVQDGQAVQVVHSVLKLEGWPWKPVPAADFPNANHPRIHRELALSKAEWQEILGLVPREWELKLYGAIRNYKQRWIELWMFEANSGTPPCGGPVLLFFRDSDSRWKRIDEGVSWGSCKARGE